MRYLFFIIFILLSNLFGFTQTKEELEKQRLEANKHILYTNDLIKETEKNRKNSYNKILLLNSNLQRRKTIISSIEQEIIDLNSEIQIKQQNINRLEVELEMLKKEYANFIYHSYLHKNDYYKIMFFFASKNFNTAFSRLKYYQQYTRSRKEYGLKLNETKQLLGNQLIQLENLLAYKNSLLDEKRTETSKLLAERNAKDDEVKRLIDKEKDLRKKLKEQNELADRLKKEIQKIIEEETRKAAELLKKKNKGVFQLTPEEKLLADVFVKNKNKLPWPTLNGTITGEFGEQDHPFLKGIKVKNDGIDISTNENSAVRSIYDGVVSRIFVIPGANKTVIIRHGNYLTVYSNLKEVYVKQGDRVKTKQEIGVVHTEVQNDHKSVLQFQIWKENEKLNPVEWLAKMKNG
jgi:septal ring factor EnvC (AmiA/AmiB activator)